MFSAAPSRSAADGSWRDPDAAGGSSLLALKGSKVRVQGRIGEAQLGLKTEDLDLRGVKMATLGGTYEGTAQFRKFQSFQTEGVITGFDAKASSYGFYMQNTYGTGEKPYSGVDIFTGSTNYNSPVPGTPTGGNLAIGDTGFDAGEIPGNPTFCGPKGDMCTGDAGGPTSTSFITTNNDPTHGYTGIPILTDCSSATDFNLR